MRQLFVLVLLAGCASPTGEPPGSGVRVPTADVARPLPRAATPPVASTRPKKPPVMACGASSCTEQKPVCCIETPGSANPSATFCAATWRDCEADSRDAFFHTCNRPDDCPSGERCCHIEAKGERCEATCTAPSATVCQTTQDCPATDTDGTALVECAQEVGAYVHDTHGFCSYQAP